jgi:Amt family ammonium transporter
VGVTDYLAVDSSVNGIPYSASTQITAQIIAVVVAIAWTAIVSYLALMVCKATTGLRVTEQQEREGLDIVDHGERAYN